MAYTVDNSKTKSSISNRRTTGISSVSNGSFVDYEKDKLIFEKDASDKIERIL